jgi:glutamate dehydrogenase (NAD(P)+)
MAWVMDEFGRKAGHSPACVTGKPLELGGSQGREAATGKGVAIITREACGVLGIDLKGARVVMQGFGNVGSFAARFLEEMGAKLVAVADHTGGVRKAEGLDVEALITHAKANKGGVAGFKGGEAFDAATVFAQDCEILIPAALGGVITKANAKDVKAKLIVEGANAPTTTDADAILKGMGVTVIPDILANAGGVTVSYFEWVKNLSHIRFGRMQRRAEEARNHLIVRELERLSDDQGLGWTLSPGFKRDYLTGAGELELVRSGLDDTMREAYRSMRELWHARPEIGDLRTAAYIVSIGRVAASYRAKGL